MVGHSLGLGQNGFPVLGQEDGGVEQAVLPVFIENPQMGVFLENAGQGEVPLHQDGALRVSGQADLQRQGHGLAQGVVIAQGAEQVRLHGDLPGLLRQTAVVELDAAQRQEGLVHGSRAADR